MTCFQRLLAFSFATTLSMTAPLALAADSSILKLQYIHEGGPGSGPSVVPKISSLTQEVSVLDRYGSPNAHIGMSTPFVASCSRMTNVEDGSSTTEYINGKVDSGFSFIMTSPRVDSTGTSFSLRAGLERLTALTPSPNGGGCQIELPTVEAWTIDQYVHIPSDGTQVSLGFSNGARLVISAIR